MVAHFLVNLEITSQLGQAGICFYQGRHHSAWKWSKACPISFGLVCVLAEQKALAPTAWSQLMVVSSKETKMKNIRAF